MHIYKYTWALHHTSLIKLSYKLYGVCYIYAHCSPTLDRPLHLEIHSRGRYWILLGTLFSLSPQLPIFSFFLSWLNAIFEPIRPL
jgi:hypothetical protein